ncbi:hypothetical protein RO3G_15811 [Rhizopus delemar RA 99-880]|uniref:Tc1-like transposase DDE domain-containing protein n=1 Tax=Rhizopus delemar (strain RA 99-880 / ATCC MYA-4621 / FGSC 9543 / NRRL 43880) TaxID=246409 RepID=I1CRM0_RHIO9|nr:hypothetical protein RO3G_15811 [Rhizopus delemar RA 99-880]|eukprot:EIE91100.1 hypothetical protein RO3G_15811 [Rhizopus delemar RA 99-880]
MKQNHTIRETAELVGLSKSTVQNNTVNAEKECTGKKERNFTFQEDGYFCHTSDYARWWKETLQIRGFGYWLAQSTDLNLIEHVWNALERQIERKRLSVKNLQQLKVALQKECVRLDDEFADRLARSMKRRYEAIIKAKSSATGY